jgi:hypothetical protein
MARSASEHLMRSLPISPPIRGMPPSRQQTPVVSAHLARTMLYSASPADSSELFIAKPRLTFLFGTSGERTLPSPKLFEAPDPLALTIQNA